MKKFSKILTMLLALLLTMSVLTACDLFNKEEEHEHDFGKWKVEKEATCEKAGEQVRECDCGEEESEEIPKLEHEYKSEVTQEATCAAEGVTTFTCSGCGHTYTEPIAKTAHTYTSAVTTPATCAAEGVTTFTCSGCSDTYTEPIGKISHIYTSAVTTPASCVSDEITTFTCSGCSDSYTESKPATVYTSTEISELYKPMVGEVVVSDANGNEFALGTCFVISEDGTLLTNYHVIEYGYSAKVYLNDKEYTVEKLLAYDKHIDVAVLKINATGLTAAKLCKLDHKTGEVVYAYGSSQGLTLTFSDGIISMAVREVDGVCHVQHDAPISSGNSGGPLINTYGEVIGINTWYLRESQNLNFAIHLKELDKLDYSTPMTMAEYYEKECDPYTRLMNYVVTYGEYDASVEAYSIELDTRTSDSGTVYTQMLYYYPDLEEVTLDIVYNYGEYWVYLDIEKDSEGIYDWHYFDENDYYMDGVVYASIHTSESLLLYSNHNAGTTDLRDSIQKIATLLVEVQLLYLDDVLAPAGVTAKDLGFVNF